MISVGKTSAPIRRTGTTGIANLDQLPRFRCEPFAATTEFSLRLGARTFPGTVLNTLEPVLIKTRSATLSDEYLLAWLIGTALNCRTFHHVIIKLKK